MDHGFSRRCFDGPAVSLYLAHQHPALNRRNTEISHFFLVGLLDKASLCFLFHKECSHLVLYDFEDEAHVLTD
jgi:hypothetical protein